MVPGVRAFAIVPLFASAHRLRSNDAGAGCGVNNSVSAPFPRSGCSRVLAGALHNPDWPNDRILDPDQRAWFLPRPRCTSLCRIADGGMRVSRRSLLAVLDAVQFACR